MCQGIALSTTGKSGDFVSQDKSQHYFKSSSGTVWVKTQICSAGIVTRSFLNIELFQKKPESPTHASETEQFHKEMSHQPSQKYPL